MKHLKIDHLHFFSTDLDEAVKFYTDLGCKIVQRFEHSGREAVQLQTHFGMIIDINKTRASDNPGYSHFCMMVEDIMFAYDELNSKGYWIDGPVFNEDTKRHIITVRDPNGFLVQLVQKNNNI
jgi:catechol 2,3-dioxygenase-like lactoylglutathione lyase family enzyme